MKAIIIFFALLLSTSYARELKVAVIDIPPFGLIQEGELEGIHSDFIKEVLKEAGLRGSFRLLPYKRVVSRIQRGKADLTLIFRNKKLKNAHEVAKSIPFKNVIFARKDSGIKDLEGLKDKRIGLIRSASYEPAFDRLKDIDRMPLENYHQGFMMLEKGRLEAVVASMPAYLYAVKVRKKPYKNLAQAFILNEKHNYFYASNNVSAEIREKIKKANKKVMDSGALKRIMEDYLSGSK